MATKLIKDRMVEQRAIDAAKPAPLTLIKRAVSANKAELTEIQSINSSLQIVAETQKTTYAIVAESVTHILANITNTIEQGKPLQLLHINSLAAFLAGVEAIANALPTSQSEQRVQNTLRVLAVAGLNQYGDINGATIPIVNLGARKEELKAKYLALLQAYLNSQNQGRPNGVQLNTSIRQLRMSVERAMRSSMQPKSGANASPSSPGSAPASI